MVRNVFVTGATGFVGRHLVDRLVAHGMQVRALVRPTSDTAHLESAGVELVPGDLRDEKAIRRGVEGADIVYHLAAVTAARTDREYASTNSDGTAALLAGIRLATVRPSRLVYLSSYAAVGPWDGRSPRARGDPETPLTSYGRTKLEGERIVREAEKYGVEVLVIRSPAVFGPGDRALLPYFRLVRSGLAPVPGGDDRRLHLIYVKDLAEALARAADSGQGTVSVADPRIHRWSDVVGTIAKVFGKSPVWIHLPQPLVRFAAAFTEWVGRVLGRAVPFNREKAEEMLASGWVCDLSGSEALLPATSVTPLEQGIDETIRWYIRQGWI